MATKVTKVGKYQLTSKIAEGGMGAIYKAKHPTLNRDIILKRLILRQSSSITERFKREAQLMIDFRNDHIVQVYDHFKEGNSYYIAMEFVDGISLSDLIKKKRYIPNEIAMLIIIEICKALKYAHDRNVIHRDIKPENVLISKKGEVKLTDFGIATSKDCEEECLTSAGTTLGTPAYMSPEQITDTKNVDKRADIYSMGVVLYEMVTGKCPFPGNFTPEAITIIQKGDYTSPRKINPRISSVIQKVIKKAMHCKVKKRYRDLQYIIDIFLRRLKKYKDQETINNTIKGYIFGSKEEIEESSGFSISNTLKKSIDSVAVKLSSNYVRILLVIAILIGIIAVGGYCFYSMDMHYEYFKQQEYGALCVDVRIDKKYKDPGANYINASLFIREGKRYKSVKDKDLYFKLDEKANSKKYYSFKSPKVYLKSSMYRIRIDIENELFQKDFYIKPRGIQKKEKETIDAKYIKLYYKKVSRLPLKIHYTVKDINTNLDITDDTELYINFYKKWYKWIDFIELKNYKEILTTDRTYKFNFVREGYYNKYLRIYVKPYQTNLVLDLDLVPVPGTLSVKSNYKGLDILLNNSNYYFSGGKGRKYIKIAQSRKKFQKLLLSPGDYFITVKKSGSVSKTVKTRIVSKESKKAIINYNQDRELININIY
ncbi:MAG: serine/threonine-protein kinase [Spirochaetota bacterium]|nr:serine/threonine-protein kinase [Spirochaetota bacterium]